MSCERYGLEPSWQCVRWMATAGGIRNMRLGKCQTLKNMTGVKKQFRMFTKDFGKEGRNKQLQKEKENLKLARYNWRSVTVIVPFH